MSPNNRHPPPHRNISPNPPPPLPNLPPPKPNNLPPRNLSHRHTPPIIVLRPRKSIHPPPPNNPNPPRHRPPHPAFPPKPPNPETRKGQITSTAFFWCF